jgi:hypothetical protein
VELLCLLVGLLIPVVALGLVVRRAVRPLASASAYRNVAWKLGLEADTRGVSVHGWLDGRRLFVGEAVDGEAGRRGAELRAVLDLATPLGLGLHARRRASRSGRALGRFRGTPGLRLDDKVLDDALEVRTFDPERAKALFTDDVRAQLRSLLAGGQAVELTDHWVRVRPRRPPASDKALLALIDALMTTAAALEQARARLPTPEALRDRLPGWAAAAEALGLQLDAALPALVGAVDGRRVTVHAVRGERGFLADVRVQLRPHPPSGLSIAPAHGARAAPDVGQRIATGDEDFDATYVVKGYDPGALRARLGEDARAGLLALARRGRVRVHDAALEVHGVDVDPDAVRHAVGAALGVVAALGW